MAVGRSVSYTRMFLQHLKQTLCHLNPPATFSSAAYTFLSHLGHLGASGALKGIVSVCLLAAVGSIVVRRGRWRKVKKRRFKISRAKYSN